MAALGPRPWYWVQTPAAFVKADPCCVGCGCAVAGKGWAEPLGGYGRLPLFAARQYGGQIHRYLVCSIECAVAVEVRVAVDGEQVAPN